MRDLARWEHNYFKPRVGGTAVIEQMHATGTLNSGKALDYAFGLSIGTYRGQKTAEHSGGDAGYRSHLLRFPDARLSVAVLCNLSAMAPRRLAYQVADLYLAEILDVPTEETDDAGAEGVTDIEPGAEIAGTPPAADLSHRIGVYRDPITEQTRELVLDDGALMVKEGEGRVGLRASTNGRFVVVGRPITLWFEAAEGGYARDLMPSGGEGPDHRLRARSAGFGGHRPVR